MSLENIFEKKIFKVIYQTWDTVFDHRSITEKRVENTTCSGVLIFEYKYTLDSEPCYTNKLKKRAEM